MLPRSEGRSDCCPSSTPEEPYPGDGCSRGAGQFFHLQVGRAGADFELLRGMAVDTASRASRASLARSRCAVCEELLARGTRLHTTVEHRMIVGSCRRMTDTSDEDPERIHAEGEARRGASVHR